jgi:hypothetical protein
LLICCIVGNHSHGGVQSYICPHHPIALQELKSLATFIIVVEKIMTEGGMHTLSWSNVARTKSIKVQLQSLAPFFFFLFCCKERGVWRECKACSFVLVMVFYCMKFSWKSYTNFFEFFFLFFHICIFISLFSVRKRSNNYYWKEE